MIIMYVYTLFLSKVCGIPLRKQPFKTHSSPCEGLWHCLRSSIKVVYLKS